LSCPQNYIQLILFNLLTKPYWHPNLMKVQAKTNVYFH
jgi:hypothetical protein